MPRWNPHCNSGGALMSATVAPSMMNLLIQPPRHKPLADLRAYLLICGCLTWRVREATGPANELALMVPHGHMGNKTNPPIPIPATKTSSIEIKLSKFIWLATLRLVLVVCCCLILVNKDLSRNLVQAAALPVVTPINGLRRSSRRRGQDPVSTVPASYSRYSSEMQDCSSIDQQKRRCRDAAGRFGLSMDPTFEFADEAVSGTKRDREGLNALLAAARAGKIGIIFFDSLSRLARETVISLTLLKELVHVHGIRVISVTEGVDSDNGDWELVAIFRSWMHQEFIKTLALSVIRGLEDGIEKGWSVGDWNFGYASEPIPGSDKSRKGREPKPRMRYLINEEHANWVRRIFQWFVKDRRSIAWIVRELNRLDAPKDRRARTKGWHHSYVVKLLRNKKYIGIWHWGRTARIRNPITGCVYQEPRPDEESAKWVRHLPDLRIVDDETFFKANALLDESAERLAASRRKNGQLAGSQSGNRRPRHLLERLLKCSSCGATFQRKTGTSIPYMGCPNAHRGLCSVSTCFPRSIAIKQILGVISHKFLEDLAWRSAIAQETRRAWEVERCKVPAERARLEKLLKDLDKKISHLIDRVESGDKFAEVSNRLSDRRRERSQVERQLSTLSSESSLPAESPSDEWIDAKCRDLRALLHDGTPAAWDAVRRLIGIVTVHEIVVPRRKRKALRGTFCLKVREIVQLIGAKCSSEESEASVGQPIEVTLTPTPPWQAWADRVKELFDSERRFDQIAQDLSIPYNWVQRAFVWWHESRGLPVPSARRNHLRRKPIKLAEQLADAAKSLWDQHLRLGEIAKRLGCTREMARDAVRFWFESRSMPYPDGRSRRWKAEVKPAEGIEMAPRLPAEVPTDGSADSTPLASE